MTTLDAPRDARTPVPSIDSPVAPIPAPITSARAAVASAATDYVAILDPALERPWTWRDVENDVRYGIYRAAETIEAASAELEGVLAGAPARPAAVRLIAPATIARWSLQGRLATIADPLLDRVPKDGEWTARQTLGHIIGSQRGYGVWSQWWLSIPLGPDRPRLMPDEVSDRLDAELPSEVEEGAGSVADLRARLDAVLDEWAMRFAALDEAALSVPATWSGTQVDIAFRIVRWGSHMAEHTVQLDKTLDWLGAQPREVARIVRDLHAAWGRLESRIWPAATTAPGVDAVLSRMSATLVAEARDARAAAEA